MSDQAVKDQINDLAQDTSSGAVEVAHRGAVVMTTLAERTEATELASFRQEVAETGRLLIRSQPSMAPLFNLVNSVLWSVDDARDLKEARQRVGDTARSFADELTSASEKIASEALDLISPGATVLTHSRSSTVLRALLSAKIAGRDTRAVCTESRPLYEGRTVAEELSGAGIPTTLVTEGGVGWVMEGVDLVLVGADTVCLKGLVNKTGTYGLAVAARARGIPFYTLCGTEKFLPGDYPHFEIERKDPEEVWPGHPPGVTVLNYYFDVTPLEYVGGLVTEKGLLKAEELEKRLAELRIHEALLLEAEDRGRIERE